MGDLDRVIQIDAPPTVSSFLQRMGRTGRSRLAAELPLPGDERRQPGAGRRADRAVVEGLRRADRPAAQPYHILAQQLMALALQEQGIGRVISGSGSAACRHSERCRRERRDEVLRVDDRPKRSSGTTRAFSASDRRARRRTVDKNFLELFSVFLSPPLFSVLHGRQELGFVDELTFLGKTDGPRILLLGGRAWLVNHIDWQRRLAYVEADGREGTVALEGMGRGS